MLMHRICAALVLAWAATAPAAQPSPADLTRLNRTLNPTKTPNAYGLESHVNAGDQDIDAQGNHLFARVTPHPAAGDDQDHRVAARVKPCPAFRPLWGRLRDFEAQIGAYQSASVISRARANAFRERLALLRINYGLAHRPDGSELTPPKMKSLAAELEQMKKGLLP